MAVKGHPLDIELFWDVDVWRQPKIDKSGFQLPLRRGYGVNFLSAIQQYQYNSFYWCNRLVAIFDRLEWIRDMTGRSVHRRKNEKKSVFLEEWIMYNYEHYTVVYQAILDVALLLTNELFRLGNPYKKCSYSTVCDNTHINGTSVHHILEKLKDTTDKHREGKNLLVHRGERIRPPVDAVNLDTTEIINMAIKVDIELGETAELLSEFLSIHSQKELIKTMEKECTEIESQVEDLFSALLPYYRKFRSANF